MSSYGAIGGVDDDSLRPQSPSSSPVRRVASAQSLTRRPYMYQPAASRAPSTSTSLSPTSSLDQNMAIRYRLFNRLDPGGHSLVRVLGVLHGLQRMPDHVLPGEFFSILPFDDFKDDSGKQGSIVTIFSIWNTMMGTSLLAMPWALQQAGLVWGLLLMLAVAGLALYTAYLVVLSPRGLTLSMDSHLADFPDVCRFFFGFPGELIAVCFSILVLLGGVIVYWVLMSNFLYYTGTVFYDAMQANSTTIPVMANKTFKCDVFCPSVSPVVTSLIEDVLVARERIGFDSIWSLQGTVPFVLAMIAMPLLNFKSPTFFTKFNMLGTISVIYLLVFTTAKTFECGFNMNFLDPRSPHYVALFSWKFPALTGTLTLSYFIHNAVLTILRNQKNPANNARDLCIGYACAAFCYIFIGFAFFAAFPVTRTCIADNFLNNFGSGDVMSATARVFLLFQMFTVLPLLMYLIRAQVSYAIVGRVYPGGMYVLMLNLGVIAMAIFFAIVFPHVGNILRFVGSLAGLVYVFALPCAVYVKRELMFGRLTTTKLVLHVGILLLGVANLLAQFVIA